MIYGLSNSGNFDEPRVTFNVIRLLQTFSSEIFSYSWAAVDQISTDGASRDPSAIGKFLLDFRRLSSLSYEIYRRQTDCSP